jgi:GTP-binding protein Era
MRNNDGSVKSAFIGLIGRPSCGKSTLINRICGHKVSIISPVPQTTRNRVRGIYNAPEGQLVFVDTPGFHLSERKMNLYLKQLAFRTLKEVDLVLYLLDATRLPGEEEGAIMGVLAGYEDVLVIGLNKIDVAGNVAEQIRTELPETLRSAGVFLLSGLTGEGVPSLLDALWELAPEGQRLYPEDYYTDQDPAFRIAEIVREKAIAHTREEVPHALFVQMSDLEMQEEGHLWARGFIYVERESQKGILVGKKGERIRTIVRESEAELAELFPYPVRLDLRVKTRPKWRKDDGLLRQLIT